MLFLTISAQHFIEGDLDAATACLNEAVASSAQGFERALAHHLLALVRAASGALDEAAEAVSAAAAIERELGCVHGAEHTTHQIVLLRHLEGDLKRARGYYKDTFRTLYGMNNRRGMALCLRSLGEMAVLYGKRASALSCWSQALEHFEALELPEAQALQAWLHVLPA